MVRKIVATAVGTAFGVALIIGPATAGSSVTKMKFELGAREVAAGSLLSGSVSVWSRDGTSWMPVTGAQLSVVVDGTQVGTLVTDTSGWATLSWPAALAEGGHTMKVVFGGDAAHAKSQRAQGFTVTAALPATGTVPDAPFVYEGSSGFGFVHLAWFAPPDGGSSILEYNVYRGTSFGEDTFYATVPGAQTDFTDIGVVSAQQYFYTVTAVNAVGESAPSNVMMVSAG